MLERLTLHQLRALVVLTEERSVTAAARRLGVTQPALSHLLASLREVLNDPILVAGRGGMVLTARAEAMAPALRRALRDLEVALGTGAPTDPSAWKRTVVLATWDGITLTLLPHLLGRLGVEAPGVSLDVVPVPTSGSGPALEDGRFDLAIEVRPSDAPGLQTRRLATDGLACVVRRDHPAVGEKLDLATYLRLPHALISPQGSGRSVVDGLLEAAGHRRHVALRIRYFLAAPLIVASSDLILTAPRSLCHRLAELAPLRVLAPPLPIPDYAVQMVWHERSDADPVHRWIREALVDAATRIGAG